MDVPKVALAAPEEESEEDIFPRVTALPSFKERTYPHERAELTSKDLERAARVHEPDEIMHDYQGELLPDGTEVCPSPLHLRHPISLHSAMHEAAPGHCAAGPSRGLFTCMSLA